MDPYSVLKIRAFYEYDTNYDLPILVKISLQKVDLGDDYTQKFQVNFKKRFTSDTIV